MPFEPRRTARRQVLKLCCSQQGMCLLQRAEPERKEVPGLPVGEVKPRVQRREEFQRLRSRHGLAPLPAPTGRSAEADIEGRSGSRARDRDTDADTGAAHPRSPRARTQHAAEPRPLGGAAGGRGRKRSRCLLHKQPLED